ncbi:MAG: DUF2961 domain-containing protein [Actinomycetota bacterium]
MTEGSGFDLSSLARLRPGIRRRRASTWDRTGGNQDSVFVAPGAEVVVARDEGPGSVTHLWFTLLTPNLYWGRDLVLRAWWDGESTPSVEAPLGDFFGAGNCLAAPYTSALLEVAPRDGASLHSWFPMPFAEGFRISVTNESALPVLGLYAYIDYESWPAADPTLGRFHAWWNRRRGPGIRPQGPGTYAPGINLTDHDNYPVLAARGPGHYVGTSLAIHSPEGGWYGEGDEMIFVDSQEWPPAIHGTGTEDYFGTAWGPSTPFHHPQYGQPLADRDDWAGFSSVYRFHAADPVMFEQSIRVSLEQGHANDRTDDYSSVAYWYQTGRREPLPPLPSIQDRRPPWPASWHAAATEVGDVFAAAMQRPEVLTNPDELGRFAVAAGHIARCAYRRDWAAVRQACEWLGGRATEVSAARPGARRPEGLRAVAGGEVPADVDEFLAGAVTAWVDSFDPEAAGTAEIVFGFRISADREHAWELRIADGRCTAARGSDSHQRLTLAMDPATFAQFTLGELDLWEAILRGDLRARGDGSIGLRLPALFPLCGPEIPGKAFPSEDSSE